MKLCLTYQKTGLARFMSHRDMMRVIFRALNRSRLPVAYSQGYNPHPRVEFCPPLGVGVEGLAEELELRLTHPVSGPQAREQLNYYFPEGIKVTRALWKEEDKPNLSHCLISARYCLRPFELDQQTEKRMQALLSCSEYPFVRARKGEPKRFNLRAGIIEASGEQGELDLVLRLQNAPKPLEVFEVVSDCSGDELASIRITRTNFYRSDARVSAPAIAHKDLK